MQSLLDWTPNHKKEIKNKNTETNKQTNKKSQMSLE